MTAGENSNIITNCQFYGIKWEKEALETLQTVAEALLNLTKVFAATNIQIDCLLKVDQGVKLPTFSSAPYVSKGEPIKEKEE